MELIIPNDKVEKLTEVAIAEEPTEDPRGSLSETELRESATDCVRINEKMKTDTERDAREALNQLGKKFGFETPQGFIVLRSPMKLL